MLITEDLHALYVTDRTVLVRVSTTVKPSRAGSFIAMSEKHDAADSNETTSNVVHSRTHSCNGV